MSVIRIYRQLVIILYKAVDTITIGIVRIVRIISTVGTVDIVDTIVTI